MSYQVKPVEQYLDNPVVKQAISGGFYYVYGYTRWQVCDSATGKAGPDLYETREDAAAAIRAMGGRPVTGYKRESLPLNRRVQRWDVYDAADHIADIPGLIARGKYAEAAEVAHEWERKLFAAAERGGTVGPYPEYRQS